MRISIDAHNFSASLHGSQAVPSKSNGAVNQIVVASVVSGPEMNHFVFHHGDVK
jgi:hypothetical protein